MWLITRQRPDQRAMSIKYGLSQEMTHEFAFEMSLTAVLKTHLKTSTAKLGQETYCQNVILQTSRSNTHNSDNRSEKGEE